MAFSTFSGIANFYNTDTLPQYTLGALVTGSDGREWKYAQAGSSDIPAGTVVNIPNATNVAVASASGLWVYVGLGGADGGSSVLPAGNYGWFAAYPVTSNS